MRGDEVSVFGDYYSVLIISQSTDIVVGSSITQGEL